MYETGSGVSQDKTQALFWYRKAAEAGDASAMTNLARMYETGSGVSQDKTQALFWYRAAAEAGDASAFEALKRLGQ
jgi:TPR repeat protein